MEELIASKIKESLPDAKVTVLDPHNDGRHFIAHVVSKEFTGKSRIERTRMVMAPLKPMLSEMLHALSLRTYTPDEYQHAHEDAHE